MDNTNPSSNSTGGLATTLVTTVGVLVGVAVCTVCFFMDVPFWPNVILTSAIVIVTVIVAVRMEKKHSYAKDGSLSALLDKAERLKTSTEPTDEVEQAVRARCEGHPEAWKGYRKLGELFILRGSRNKALECFLKAEQLFPEGASPEDRAAIWNEIGGAALASGKGAVAAEYFRKASEVNPTYLRGLGLMYAFGWEVETDTSKATVLFDRAVREGCETALSNLYELRWRLNNGVEKNTLERYSEYMMCCHCGRGYKAGMTALKDAASAGYAPAQFELGTLYQNHQYGDDIQTQRREAFRWLKAGADQGFLPALHNLGFLAMQQVVDPVKGTVYEPKIKGTLFYNQADIDHCTEEGRAILMKAARAGYGPSKKFLGL